MSARRVQFEVSGTVTFQVAAQGMATTPDEAMDLTTMAVSNNLALVPGMALSRPVVCDLTAKKKSAKHKQVRRLKTF